MLLVTGAIIGVCVLAGDAVPQGFRSPFLSVREETRRDVVLSGDAGRAAALAGLRDADFRVRRLSLEALGEIATDADVPSLVAAFRDRDAGVRVAAVEAFVATRGRSHAIGADEAASRGASAMDLSEALRHLAMRKILAIFDLPNPGRWAYDRRFQPIIDLGPAARPALREAARDSRLTPSVRAVAIMALARFGDRSDVPFLVALGGDEMERPRRRVDIEQQDDLPAAVAAGLAYLGTTDGSAIDLLKTMTLRGSTPIVRNWAAWALLIAAEELDSAGREAIAATAAQAFDEEGDAAVLDISAQILGWLGTPRELPPLVDAIEHERGGYVAYLFLAAAWDLSAAEPPAGTPESQTRAAVVKAFEAIAKRGLPPAAAFARVRLGRVDDGREALVLRLKRLLEGRESTEEGDAYEYGLRTACLALALLGERSAVPLLESKCQSELDDIRQAAALALAQLAEPSSLPVLRARLDDPHEFTRVLVARDLLALGERQPIGVLVDALDSGNIWSRRLAAQLLEAVRGGETDGYDPRAGLAARRESVARWRAWWRDRGPALRWDAAAKVFRDA
ncbi:MAG: HEAT repeat domain-containing protein [Planctomycetes bacterium]|nr:HEAT repeat domain-containing protein [Planctomycetota bacterium]